MTGRLGSTCSILSTLALIVAFGIWLSGCASECRQDEDCAAGMVCEAGGAECDTRVCVAGCHADEQCAPDQTCEEVVCVTCPCPGVCQDAGPEVPCRTDADCGAGMVCEDGGPGCDTPVCVQGCHTDEQCELGETCQAVVCITCPCPPLCSPPQ